MPTDIQNFFNRKYKNMSFRLFSSFEAPNRKLEVSRTDNHCERQTSKFQTSINRSKIVKFAVPIVSRTHRLVMRENFESHLGRFREFRLFRFRIIVEISENALSKRVRIKRHFEPITDTCFGATTLPGCPLAAKNDKNVVSKPIRPLLGT